LGVEGAGCRVRGSGFRGVMLGVGCKGRGSGFGGTWCGARQGLRVEKRSIISGFGLLMLGFGFHILGLRFDRLGFGFDMLGFVLGHARFCV